MPHQNADGGGGNSPLKKRPASSQAILVFALELVAVGIFTVLAGISHDVGKIVIIFMVGLWLIYLVTNSGVVAGINNALTTVVKGG